MKRMHLLAVAAVLLLTVAIAAPVSATATIDSWSTPVRVINGGFDALSEVVDSTNHVHIAATGRHGLWYITDRSGSWTRSKVLGDTSTFSYVQPSIAIDEHDRVYIAATRIPNAAGDLGIWLVTDKGHARGTFSSPTRIAAPGNGEPQLKVRGGHIFLVDVRGWCCVGDGTVVLRTDVTGHWTVAEMGRGQSPSMRLGSDGRPRVVFTRSWPSPPKGLIYAVASSASGGFSTTKIPGTDTHDYFPLLALDSGNRARVAWTRGTSSGQSIQYVRQDATGWRSIQTLATPPSPQSIGFDLDTLGRPNVAWGGSSVHYDVLTGGTWHKSTVATGTHVGSIVLRRAFNGRVVIVWTDLHGGGIWVSRN